MSSTKNIRRASLKQLREMKNRGEILGPRSDAPEFAVPKEFWENAVPFSAMNKASIHLRLDSDVLDWFKAQGPGHLTRMNAVLRSYYEAQVKKPKRRLRD